MGVCGGAQRGPSQRGAPFLSSLGAAGSEDFSIDGKGGGTCPPPECWRPAGLPLTPRTATDLGVACPAPARGPARVAPWQWVWPRRVCLCSVAPPPPPPGCD